ncbi:MAG: DUF2742 domain-containing protein [Mycobacterium sp.]
MSWWSVHEYVAPVLARCHDPIPMVGSVAWQQLPDDHPAKIAAVFDAARHWALRVDTCQEASAEASRAISDAADWSDVAEQIRGRREFLAENPWAKRRPA